MADEKVNADALRAFLTGTPSSLAAHTQEGSLGGQKLSTRVKGVDVLVSSPIPGIKIEHMEGVNFRQTDAPHPQHWFGQDSSALPGFYRPYRVLTQVGFLDPGRLEATGVNALTWNAPGDEDGAATAVTIANGETKVIESELGESFAVVVSRDSATDLAGVAQLTIRKVFNNAVAMNDAATGAAADNYRGIILENVSAKTISNIKLWAKPFTTETAIVNIVGSRTASGAYQQVLTNPQALDWPKSGYAAAYATGTTSPILEIVYYTTLDFDAAGTPIKMGVLADGRGLLDTSAGVSTGNEDLYPVPGIRVGSEAVGANGDIQAIANETTAPAAVTFFNEHTEAEGLDIGTLTTGQTIGVWIHREVPATLIESFSVENKIGLSYDYDTAGDNVAIDTELAGLYRVEGSNSTLYTLYVGEDVDANPLSTPNQTSATLPITYAVTPPGSGTKTVNFIVRVMEESFGLQSQNFYQRSIVIDSAGNEVTPEIAAPTNVTLTNVAGGDVDVSAQYSLSLDSSPADTFNIYWTVDGVDPDPDVDTPITQLMATDPFSRKKKVLKHTFSNLDFGVDLRVIVRAVRTKGPAIDEPNGFVITSGGTETEDEDSTHALDGLTHNLLTVLDTVYKIECYYEFDLGRDGVPTGIQAHHYFVKGGGDVKNLTVWAYNWGGATWNQVGTLNSGTALATDNYTLTSSHVGTGGNLGKVRFRYLTGSVALTATSELFVDQIFCEYTAESQNTTVTSTTVNTSLPGGIDLRTLFVGGEFSTGDLSTAISRTVVVDEGTNVHFVLTKGKTCFYSDTDLIWCCFYDSSDLDAFSTLYVPSDIIFKDTAVSRSGTTDAIEVVSATEIYVNVAGESRMKIDLSAGTIECAQFFDQQTLTASVDDEPASGFAASTLFNVYDENASDYVGYAEMNSTGQLKCDINYNLTLTQAAIEAL